MKKITTATIAAMFAMTSLSAPAMANDIGRIGVGLGIAVLGEIIKGAGQKGGGKKRRGGTLIGRVDGSPAPRQTTQRKGGGKGKAVAAGAGAATVAAVAYSLPEVGPTPEPRPDPVQVAQAAPQIEQATEDPNAQFDESIPLYDDAGNLWGYGSEADLPRIEAQLKAGKTTAEAFAALGFKMQEPHDPIANATLKPSLPPAQQAQAPQVAQEADPQATLALVDENGTRWGAVGGSTAEAIRAVLATGMKPSDAFAALSGLPNPNAVQEPTATAEAEDVQPVATEQAAPQTEQAKTEEAEPPAVKIDLGQTAAIEPKPEAVEAPKAPPEPEKPKLKLDL